MINVVLCSLILLLAISLTYIKKLMNENRTLQWNNETNEKIIRYQDRIIEKYQKIVGDGKNPGQDNGGAR